MGYTLAKNKLSKDIFKDNYTRKVWGSFGDKTSFRNSWHRGVDYGANIGEKMYALEDGLVTVAQNGGKSQLEKDFGKFIGIYYPKWDVTIMYSHCNTLNVKWNTKVKKGQFVATAGRTGKVQGAHVDVMIANGRRIALQTVYNNAFDFEKYVPQIKNNVKEVKEDGEITVTVNVGLRVRQSPSLKAKQIKLLPKGTKKVYTHYVDAEGYRWVKLKEGGYAARRTLDNKTINANARYLKPQPNNEIKVGDRVTCTATKDVNHIALDKNMFDGKKKYKVLQVGRLGNKNQILLGGVVTWVDKSTCRKA